MSHKNYGAQKRAHVVHRSANMCHLTNTSLSTFEIRRLYDRKTDMFVFVVVKIQPQMGLTVVT